MGITSPFKDQSVSITKRLLPWTLYALLPIALLRLYFYPLSFPASPETDLPNSTPITIISHSSLSTSAPPSPGKNINGIEYKFYGIELATWDAGFDGSLDLLTCSLLAEKEKIYETPCDYFDGKWIRDKRGPLYNGTTCSTIKKGQNCMTHGRPDSDYLYWRWKPSQCRLPRFEPQTFLQLISNKHIAFVGDSMARNQLESLLCMLTTAATPNLVYRNGEDNKFRKWHFPSHNVSVSLYWSPFLVQGVEKSNSGPNHNKLYLDHVDERWARDMDQMDLIVLSIGHWFLHPAVYYEGSSVLGCHYCPGLNHTEIGFFDVLRKALRTTLNSIIDRKGGKGYETDIIVTTFSPAHFEGEWDKAGACPKTKPYRKGDKQLEGMDADMRRIEIEEVEDAKTRANNFGGIIRLEALDVTKLALLRPDGHPGPYMYPFPFANGHQERVQNDCVHWCLPGPIDTWNEIFLEFMKKWGEHPRFEE